MRKNRNNFQFWKKIYKIRYWSSLKKDTDRQFVFIKEFLPLPKYRYVLDFMCGFGRHALRLAEEGYQVEGFDIDEESIAMAYRQIKLKNLRNIKIYRQDAVKFHKKNFNAAICFYSSVGCLDEESNEKIFNNLLQSVKIEGRIILDVMNPTYAIKHLTPYMIKIKEYKGKKYFIKHRRSILYNPVREKNIITVIDIQTHKKYSADYTLRLYSENELKIKFRKGGFKIKNMYGSFCKEKTSEDLERIIVVADRIK
jgi:SAM-dependent methyltransferase